MACVVPRTPSCVPRRGRGGRCRIRGRTGARPAARRSQWRRRCGRRQLRGERPTPAARNLAEEPRRATAGGGPYREQVQSVGHAAPIRAPPGGELPSPAAPLRPAAGRASMIANRRGGGARLHQSVSPCILAMTVLAARTWRSICARCLVNSPRCLSIHRVSTRASISVSRSTRSTRCLHRTSCNATR